MVFEGARACPKQIRWPPDSSGCRTKTARQAPYPETRRWAAAWPRLTKASVTHRVRGGLRRAATCQRASVCESFLSHALRLLCPSAFPLRAHVLYFWPGGGKGSHRAREPSTLSQASLVSHVWLICMKRIEDKRLFFSSTCGFWALEIELLNNSQQQLHR